MPEVALSAQGVRSDPVSGRARRREKFILIPQLQPGESIISFPEVQSGFQQIAIKIAACCNLVNSPPYETGRPIPPGQPPVVFCRRCLPPLAVRVECLRVLQTADAVLCTPVSRRRHAGTRRPRIQRRELDAPSLV